MDLHNGFQIHPGDINLEDGNAKFAEALENM
jgi:hypothetical protein